jgi:2-oxo-4-hydroxy-4-carboxy-5-ureidoimidazoline decarboxylase
MSETTAETTLDELNQLPAPAASRLLSGVCSAERWVGAVLAGRPYSSIDALLARSDAAVAAMTEADLRGALTGHPRIGDRQAAATGWSGQEQAGVQVEDAEFMRALTVANSAYEQRYGHIYLVCAAGRSGRELLELLLERLRNDRATEWRVVAAELAKINQLRLRKLVIVPPPAAEPSRVEQAPRIESVVPRVEQPRVDQPSRVDQPRVEQPRVDQPRVEQPRVERPATGGLSTHVLDTARGEPAGGVVVRLEFNGREISRGTTDADGRVSDFGVGQLGPGVYRLVFETEGYLGPGQAFFPEVVVTFRADGRRPRYHVPLLLSAYSFATYRGS